MRLGRLPGTLATLSTNNLLSGIRGSDEVGRVELRLGEACVPCL
jgi:hypothetical protein